VLRQLEKRDFKVFKKVQQTLAYLESDPSNPKLNTREFLSRKGPHGQALYETPVEDNSSNLGIFWSYRSEPNSLTVVDIL
jgi:hypothetical protein